MVSNKKESKNQNSKANRSNKIKGSLATRKGIKKIRKKVTKKAAKTVIRKVSKKVNRKKITPKKSRKATDSFPIVGIGASAGGLEAFSQLLSSLPANTNLAYVLVQHLDPTHESFSADILARKTQMPVEEIKDNTKVQPNHLYIIPPNHHLAIEQGILILKPRFETHGQHMSVDYFFESLAKDKMHKAIGIILSGTGTDGTLGLEAIKAEGGLAIVQDPTTAKYDGMPHSAVSSGVVDLILSPKLIAHELIRLAHHPVVSTVGKVEVKEPKSIAKNESEHLSKIFAMLQLQSHVDFTHYKMTTIKRRIARRMVINKTKRLADYYNYLQNNPQEIRVLFADILINVTAFFRDSDAFLALKKQVLAKIIKNKGSSSTIRIWVVGCSTGEEAYSIAISLYELLGDDAQKYSVQIFATDVSEQVLQKARMGQFPESIEKSVSKTRLNRFFEKNESGYKIAKFIRDICLFSRHDVTCDPPFSKVDLISCRNLLIYFDTTLQKHVLPIFHYALNPDGFLWLGKAESIGSMSSLFRVIDKTKKIYSRGTSKSIARARFKPTHYLAEKIHAPILKHSLPANDKVGIERVAEQVLLSTFVPPGVLVNNNMEIIQIRGDTTPYLKLLPGQASLNLFKMSREEIVPDLRMAIQLARKKNELVKKNNLQIEDNKVQLHFNIDVVPIINEKGPQEQSFWVLFEPMPSIMSSESIVVKGKRGKHPEWKTLESKEKQVKLLKRELTEARTYQQSVAEDHETIQEEITATNEELQSTNEELQSTNEELETAKEELQSTNEELTTVNDELQTRNNELSRLNNDLVNLLGAVDFPIVMLEADGRIRRFTSAAEKILNLLPSDIGRQIGEIRPGFDEPNLQTLVAEVMESMTLKELEVCNREGRNFRLLARPYKTSDNKIDGAVISLIDITKLKHHLNESQMALKYATSIADTLPLPLVVLDEKLHITSCNRAFGRMFEVDTEKEIGTDMLSLLGNKGMKRPQLREMISKVLSHNQNLKNFEVESMLPGLGTRIVSLNAQEINWKDDFPKAILLSIDDITESRTMERALETSLFKEKQALAEARNANKAKDNFLATLSHELRTPLTAILIWTQVLKRFKNDPDKIEHGLITIEASANAQGQLINDLLEISSIQSGKISLSLSNVDIKSVVQEAVDSLRLMAEIKNIAILIQVNQDIGKVRGDASRIQQIIWNLLTNAIKFSHENTRIDIIINNVQLDGTSFVSVRIVDQGIGFDPSFLPRMFQRFSQEDSSTTNRTHGGLGIGLALVYDLVKAHGGSVKAESPGPGKGATFTVLLPLLSDKKLAQKNQKPR